MACPHHWTSPFQVGGQQIGRALVAEGWDVAYVSNPVSPLHIVQGLSSQLRERFALYRGGGTTDGEGHLWAYVPGAMLTPHQSPILRGRWVHRGWHRLTVPNVTGMVQDRGFGEVDLLYIDAVIQAFWLRAISYRRSVLRVGDRMTGLPGFTAEMLAMQRDIAQTVDLVVYSATTLESYVRDLRPRRMLHLPNGVDVQRFAAQTEPPSDLATIPRPIAIYVGAIDDWFD
jgi:hypothetical protein